MSLHKHVFVNFTESVSKSLLCAVDISVKVQRVAHLGGVMDVKVLV